jgi:hypothetical protein
MTVALGLLASDGVVVAADSQETVQGFWKTDQGKVWGAGRYQNMDGDRSAGMCLVAGASNRAGYVDSLTRRVLDAFRDSDAVERNDVRDALEPVCKTFHEQNTAPYPDLPDVSLVIGYYRDFRMGLFSTDRGTLTPQMPYAAVGVGASEAQRVLAGMWRLRLSIRDAIVCASYAAFLAKEHVDGVGGPTDMMYIHKHQHGKVDRDIIARLEGIFRRYAKYLETPLLHRILGTEVPSMVGAGEAAEVLRRDIEGVDIPLVEGLKDFIPAKRPAPPKPKRGRKGRPPSRG